MKKLTLKDLEMLDTTSYYGNTTHKQICEQAIEECLEYKKIEDELGIDFALITTLTKFYAKNKEDNSIYEVYIGKHKHSGGTTETYIDFVSKSIHLADFMDGWNYAYDEYFYFKDYGKTWALTKDKLEDEKEN